MSVGDILTGDVTSVVSFGAFVKLPTGEEGLVHISEIADEYVTDINAFVKVGDTVEVKYLGPNEKGKAELSMKKAKRKASKPAAPKKPRNNEFEDRLNQFLKKSEEKQIDIRRNLKIKQGISKKRR